MLTNAASKRIYAKPPGSYGAIFIVVNTSSAAASTGFENSFVSNSGTIGIRMAVSAATLIEENSEEGKSVLSSIFTGLKDSAPALSGVSGIALTC